MDADLFSIALDPARCLLRIKLMGHWDVSTVDRYADAVREARATMIASGCVAGTMVALVDTRGVGPQSQDVVAAYRDRFGNPNFQPKRVATLVVSALLKRQIDRIGIPSQRQFDDENQALAWLLSPDGASDLAH